MILSTLVTSQLHFEMCAGFYGHPVYSTEVSKILINDLMKFLKQDEKLGGFTGSLYI